MRILTSLIITLGLITLVYGFEPQNCTFRTQTQGGWGSGCNGGNPGCYRDEKFANCFPDGVLIGQSDCNYALFTSATAVENFLPSGGEPAIINGQLVNTTNPLGSLAGNLLAAVLSIGFDDCDPSFSSCDTPIKDLCFLEGYCQGFSVEQVVEAADYAIGNCSEECSSVAQLPSELCNLTLSEFNSCVDLFNNAFDDGVTSTPSFGYCPPENCKFRTQTQGGWGSECNGENPGCYRDSNFADCFPDGVLIGQSDCNYALFTSATAVENFLPSGGVPAIINGHLVNTTNPLGSLAGNLLAAVLSIGFDDCDPNFSSCYTPITGLCFLEGYCQGFSVEQVVKAAN